jgi:hypothetical protein
MLIHDHEKGTIAEGMQGVAQFDSNIGVNNLFSLRFFGLSGGDCDGGNIGHEYRGLLDLFEDHPREVGATRNAFSVLVEVHCRTGFARGGLLDFRGLLQSVDGRTQGVADKVTSDLPGVSDCQDQKTFMPPLST